ncbi:MAG: hypothetical protein WD081_04090 [Gammaproteobacteria bacterium]
MNKWLFALIQFFPLSLFATYGLWHGIPTDDRWVEAFQIGAIAAALQLAIVLPQSRPTNRLILAANLYLLAGGGAVLAHQWWLLHAYAVLQESGIFVAVLAVGVATTFASSSGFVAVSGAPPALVRRASLWLLAAVVMALGASILFQGDRTWAAVVPIICLAVLHRVLVYRIRQAENGDMHNYALERPDEK